MVNTKGINLFYESIENRQLCCQIRKIEPLKRALSGVKVWITGLRRDQSVTRLTMERFEWDEKFNLIKVNPLIDWSEEMIWQYIRTNHLPYNELHDKGYPSIGCLPCTRAVKPGEELRAGRWWWELPEFKECGLHKNLKTCTMHNINLVELGKTFMERYDKPTPLYGHDDHVIYWLGIPEDTAFRCNAYLLVDGKEAILVDPGGRDAFSFVKNRVSQILEPANISAMILSHQDPDIAGSMCDWLNLNPGIRVIAGSRTHILLPHYGKAEYNMFNITDDPVWLFATGKNSGLLRARTSMLRALLRPMTKRRDSCSAAISGLPLTWTGVWWLRILTGM